MDYQGHHAVPAEGDDGCHPARALYEGIVHARDGRQRRCGYLLQRRDRRVALQEMKLRSMRSREETQEAMLLLHVSGRDASVRSRGLQLLASASKQPRLVHLLRREHFTRSVLVHPSAAE